MIVLSLAQTEKGKGPIQKAVSNGCVRGSIVGFGSRSLFGPSKHRHQYRPRKYSCFGDTVGVLHHVVSFHSGSHYHLDSGFQLLDESGSVHYDTTQIWLQD